MLEINMQIKHPCPMTTEMKARDKVVNFMPVLLVLYFV